MNNGRFSIFEAVRNAYTFVGKEWLYLLKAGLLPMAMQAVATLFIQFQRPDASQIEGYLWSLPAAVFFAWFMFLEMRLLLLGERLDRLPKDPAYLADRRHCMKLSVMATILFDMGAVVALTLCTNTDEAMNPDNPNGPLLIGLLFIIGAMAWAVRFGIIPTLAAVHYPIRPVLRQTEGMLFSLRLIGMGLLCTLPVRFLFRIFLVTADPALAELDVATKLSKAEQVTLAISDTILSLICTALLSAAVAYALKQILGAKRVTP
jgi:hypothetical protein